MRVLKRGPSAPLYLARARDTLVIFINVVYPRRVEGVRKVCLRDCPENT